MTVIAVAATFPRNARSAMSVSMTALLNFAPPATVSLLTARSEIFALVTDASAICAVPTARSPICARPMAFAPM